MAHSRPTNIDFTQNNTLNYMPCGNDDKTAEHLLLRWHDVAREMNRLRSNLLPTLLTMATALHTTRGSDLAHVFLKETGIGMSRWRGRRDSGDGDEQDRLGWRRPGLGGEDW